MLHNFEKCGWEYRNVRNFDVGKSNTRYKLKVESWKVPIEIGQMLSFIFQTSFRIFQLLDLLRFQTTHKPLIDLEIPPEDTKQFGLNKSRSSQVSIAPSADFVMVIIIQNIIQISHIADDCNMSLRK